MKIILGSEDWPLWPRNNRPVRPDSLSFSARRGGLPSTMVPLDYLPPDLIPEDEETEAEPPEAAGGLTSPTAHLLEDADHVLQAMHEIHLGVAGLMPGPRAPVDMERMDDLLDESGALEDTATHILEICGRLLK